MGNLILWEESPTDSDWTKTQVYKASEEGGSYSLATTLAIADFTYYDAIGISTDFYKIRFTNDELTLATDYSDEIQGESRYLYTDPKDVLRAAGLTTATLPDSITTNDIYDWIYDVSKNLDQATRRVYGRTETFEETLDSKYLSVRHNLILEHKEVSDITVQFRTSITPDSEGEYTWVERTEGFDYQVIPRGRIKLFVYPTIQTPYNYQDIKVSGSYGQSTIPTSIEQLCKYLSAIKIFVHITGGSYNDVTSWSLGEYNEALGEPYTNLRETVKMLTAEIKRLTEQTGVADKMQNLRYA